LLETRIVVSRDKANELGGKDGMDGDCLGGQSPQLANVAPAQGLIERLPKLKGKND
jgi:hypothetical protein